MMKIRERCSLVDALMITITMTAMMSSLSLPRCQGFNITKILNRHHKRFSTLNDLLTKTNLAAEINLHRPITLLAFDNAAAAASPFITAAEATSILAAHVILDFYDVERLTSLALSGGIRASLTTLFEETGAADPYQGRLNVSLVGEGEIAFGSAASGGDLGSKLVETVFSYPNKISVLQITTPIMVPGISVVTPSSLSSSPAPRPEIVGSTSPPPVGGREDEDIYVDSEPPYTDVSGARNGSRFPAVVLLVASCLVLIIW